MQAEIRSANKRTSQEMFSLVKEQQAGMQRVKDYCKQNNVSEGMFYYWRKKYLDRANYIDKPESGGFRLLQLEQEVQSSSALFAEYKGLKLYRAVPVDYLKELIS